MSNQYQVIVLGSGSAGQEACLRAAKAGLRTLLVEEATLGSTRHLFVIGGGYVGCGLASIYRALGSQVTMTERQSRLLPNWDPVAGEQFRNVLLEAGVICS
jgi:pyruvate/2-oxoglutarate dehydrogenase complex dihydrolipoamide dehydrogenase (E3) component